MRQKISIQFCIYCWLNDYLRKASWQFNSIDNFDVLKKSVSKPIWWDLESSFICFPFKSIAEFMSTTLCLIKSARGFLIYGYCATSRFCHWTSGLFSLIHETHVDDEQGWKIYWQCVKRTAKTSLRTINGTECKQNVSLAFNELKWRWSAKNFSLTSFFRKDNANETILTVFLLSTQINFHVNCTIFAYSYHAPLAFIHATRLRLHRQFYALLRALTTHKCRREMCSSECRVICRKLTAREIAIGQSESETKQASKRGGQKVFRESAHVLPYW